MIGTKTTPTSAGPLSRSTELRTFPSGLSAMPGTVHGDWGKCWKWKMLIGEGVVGVKKNTV